MLQSYDFIEKFWRHKWYKLLLWKKFWVGNDPVRLPKGAKTEVIFDWLGVSFLKKWKNFHFPAIKTDWCAKECSDYYQLKALIMRNLKHTHTVVIWSLDHSEFGFEVTCCDFKKSFFWVSGVSGAFKKSFLKSQQVSSNPNSEWSKLHTTTV